MKKVIAFILFTVMILGLCGCHIFNGNDGNGGNGGNDGDDLDNQNPPASDNQPDLPENEVNVIIIAGQSNAEGNSNMQKLESYCNDNGKDYSQYVYGFEDVKISFHSHFYYADLGVYSTNKTDPFETNFVDVKVGQGKSPGFSGPELAMAEVIHESINSSQPVYIIKYTSGGTPFTGYPSWKSPSSGETGLLYSNLTKYINDGLENLTEQGLSPKIRAFVWMQGEADSGNVSQARSYKNNMRNFVKDIRNTYSSYATDTDGDNIIVVDGHIAATSVWPQHQLVNRAKTDLSNELPNYYAIDTNASGLDLKLKNDDKYGGGDDAHYTMESILKLGRAFAETIIKAGGLKYNEGEIPAINDFSVNDGITRNNVIRLEAENGNIDFNSGIQIESSNTASGGRSLGYLWDNSAPFVRFVVESDRDEKNAVLSLALTSAIYQSVTELPHPMYKTKLISVNGEPISLSGTLPARNGDSWHNFEEHSGYINLKKGTNIIDLHYDYNCSYAMEEFRINVDYLDIKTSDAIITEYKYGTVEADSCVADKAIISSVAQSPTRNNVAVTGLNKVGASVSGVFSAELSKKASFAIVFGLNSETNISEYFDLQINGKTVSINDTILHKYHYDKAAGADWREYVIADFDVLSGENTFKLTVKKAGCDVNIAAFRIYSSSQISIDSSVNTSQRFEAEDACFHNGTVNFENTHKASGGVCVSYFREGKVIVFTIFSDKAEQNVPIVICGASAKESNGKLLEITAEELATMIKNNGVAIRGAEGGFAGSNTQDWYNFSTLTAYIDLAQGKNVITFENLGPAMNMDYIEIKSAEAKLSWTAGIGAQSCVDADKNHACDVCGINVGTHAAAAGSHNCECCGKAVSRCEDFYGEGNVDFTATCTEPGQITYTCSVCGSTKVEAISIKGHNDADGDSVCDDCDAIISIVEGIPAIYINTANGDNSWATIYDREDKINGLVDYENATVSVKNCEAGYKMADVAAQVKVRGNYTLNYSKKPIRIKLSSKANMLGLHDGEKYKNWVLLADWKDLSMSNNTLAFFLGNAILGSDGFYCTDFRTVEVYLNNQYWGVYLLVEQQEAKDGRASVPEVDDDYVGNDIGYFFEYDGYYSIEGKSYLDGGEGDPTFTMSYPGGAVYRDDIGYTVKSDLNAKSQLAFIKNYMDKAFYIAFEATKGNYYKFNDDFTGVVAAPEITSVYEAVSSVIDIQSLVDIYILNELACDLDVDWSSFYISVDMSPDGNKKITFEAPWDWDSCFGLRAGICNDAKGLYAMNAYNPWFRLVKGQQWFDLMVCDKWAELKSAGVFDEAIELIEYNKSAYKDYYTKNYIRWSERLNGNSECVAQLNSYNNAETAQALAADYLINWFTKRVAYLDSQWRTVD